MARADVDTSGLGLGRLWHDLKHRRDRFRQALGILLVMLFVALGAPERTTYWVGTAVVLAGIVVRMWASGHVKKNKVLATEGPYAFVRHPLYVGNFLISVGFCLACGLWWSWLVMLVFWLFFYTAAIGYEDQKLHRLFGDPWLEWSRNVRPLLPRVTPYGRVGGEWSFNQSLRANGEPIIAVVLLALLAVLWYRLP